MSEYQLAPSADVVLPFDLPEAGARGRFVRLEVAASQAILPHDLPEPAARAEGELLALVAMLGSLLKLDGRLTVQTKSDGPLDMAVADYYGAEGGAAVRGVRGLARVDRDRLSALGKNPSFAAIAGNGALIITIRPQAGARDYQGVVQLSPEGLARSAEAYFGQSEQLLTLVRLAASPVITPGGAVTWRAAGLLLQVVPGGKHNVDDWERLIALAGTVEDLELVSTDLAGETLLWRLFNQEEVRLLPAEPIEFRCGCAKTNIEAALASYSAGEREKLADADGIIRAKCEFCATVHEIPA